MLLLPDNVIPRRYICSWNFVWEKCSTIGDFHSQCFSWNFWYKLVDSEFNHNTSWKIEKNAIHCKWMRPNVLIYRFYMNFWNLWEPQSVPQLWDRCTAWSSWQQHSLSHRTESAFSTPPNNNCNNLKNNNKTAYDQRALLFQTPIVCLGKLHKVTKLVSRLTLFKIIVIVDVRKKN